jgi:hypothetical protein
MFFLQMVGAEVWQLTVRAFLRFPFSSDPANWRHRKLVITYVLPADGGSRGRAAHSQDFVEVSLSIKFCQLHGDT